VIIRGATAGCNRAKPVVPDRYRPSAIACGHRRARFVAVHSLALRLDPINIVVTAGPEYRFGTGNWSRSMTVWPPAALTETADELALWSTT